VPTDPFVSPTLDDAPRQDRNLAPGVDLPAADPWVADRPGELHGPQPTGPMLGVPGPNIGYALSLVSRLRDRFTRAPHEHAEDAAAVVAELAMRRAASFGRAPVLADVEVAGQILGYFGGADDAMVRWRTRAVREASHSYRARRALCDAVPIDVLRLAPSVISSRVDEAREQLLASVS
jgi:hypothetical protein